MTNQPQPLSLLIAAHCSTIRRKTTDLDVQELSPILDDLVRELNFTVPHPATYFNSLNEILLALNSSLPSSLISLNSHYFFFLVRNTIQVLLQQLYVKYELNQLAIYVLRNCTLLLEYLVKQTPDVSKILHWITATTFIDALADCLNQIEKISKANDSKLFIRQIARLLNIFSDIQDRLPLDLHQRLFVRLLQPVINCLTSSTYVQLFKDLKTNSKTLTAKQKLFLVECPHFLTSYNGPSIEKTIEEVLGIMLPRYVSILNAHMKSIKTWLRPMKHAIYHLLTILVFAEGYFTSHLSKKSLRTLIDHLLSLINEPILINKIREIATNSESLIIDAALQVFSVLVHEPNALDFIKQRKPTSIFQRLISTPCEDIVLNAYVMLAYTINENNIKESQADLFHVLYTIFNLLYEAVESLNKTNGNIKTNSVNIDRNIIQLTETLRGLVQHKELKNELLKQNTLPYLIASSQKLTGLSKQFLLDSLWTLSFDKQTAEQLRNNSQFIFSLQNIPKPAVDNNQENTLHRSNSRRNNTLITSNDGLYKMADGLLWNLMKESQFRNNAQKTATISADQKYKNDIMISYCYNDKDIVHKIQQFLVNEGFNVWFDRDILHRQNMETVAEAIDNSALVIICVSDSYKRDNHCQAEAEYAYNSKRIILPLIVRKGYQIDGWLTSIIDKSTSMDFDLSNFKTSSSFLIKEINQLSKKKLSDVKSETATLSNIEQNILRVAHNVLDKQNQQTFGRGVTTPMTPARTPSLPDQQSFGRGVTTPTIPIRTPGLADQQSFGRGAITPTTPARTPGLADQQSFGRGAITPTTPARTPSLVDQQSFGRRVTTPTTPARTPSLADQQRFGREVLTPVTPARTPSLVDQQVFGRGAITPTTPARTPSLLDQQSFGRGVATQTTPALTSSLADEQSFGRGVATQTTPALTASSADQQAFRREALTTITPAHTPSLVDRQQQILHRSNSRSSTPNTTSVLATPLIINGNYKIYLPEEYTKRNTSDSTYRSTPIRVWKKKDILDFLYDLGLNLMMPLCETMTGRSLIRLYGMCQEKPSRLYAQLNNELGSRFRDFTLPMGVYIQFLIELDNILDLGFDSSQLLTPTLSNNIEHRTFMPIRSQSRASSTLSNFIVPPNRLKTITPMETIPQSPPTQNTRVVKRATFRPASSGSRAYDFVVESDEEPTEILHHVERYGNQLLFLEQQARDHRRINGFH